jgi:hypothetical protein
MRSPRTNRIAIAIGVTVGLALFAWLIGLRPPEEASDRESTHAAKTGEGAATTVPDAGGDGSDPQRRSLAPPSDAPRPERPQATAPEFAIRGPVRDESGNPVRGCRVTLRDAASDPRLAPEFGSSGFGFYFLPLTRAGSFRIRCEADGFLTKEAPVEVSESTPQPTVDFTLAAAIRIAIRFVTPSGERITAMGIPGFTRGSLAAVATRDRPGATVSREELRGESDGVAGILQRFGRSRVHRARDLPVADPPRDDSDSRDDPTHDCVLELHEKPPVYVSAVLGNVVLASESLAASVEALDLVVDLDRARTRLASLTVRILDAETGVPMAGVPVRTGPIGKALDVFGSACTSEAGVAVIAGLVQGLHAVYVNERDDDHEHWKGRVTLEPGSTLDLGTLLLTRSASVSGEVLGEDGTPIRSFDLGVLRHIDRQSAFAFGIDWAGPSKGLHGELSVSGLGRGRHRLVVSNEAWALSDTVVDTSQGSVEDVRIVLKKGTLVRLVAANGRDRSLSAGIARDDGLDLTRVDLRTGMRTIRLVPGQYLAHLYDEMQGLLATTPFFVGDAAIDVSFGP